MRLKMKKIPILSIAAVLLGVCGAMAQPPQNSPAPFSQEEKQTFPQLNGLVVPDPPVLGADGKFLNVTDDIVAPRGDIFGFLMNAPIPNIEKLNHQERQLKIFY